MRFSLSLAVVAFTSLVGIVNASPFIATKPKPSSTQVVLFTSEGCLSLDVMGPQPYKVTVTCQDALTDVTNPMHGFDMFQSGEPDCAVGNFKSFYVEGDMAAFDSLIVQNDAKTCGKGNTCVVVGKEASKSPCYKIPSSCQLKPAVLQVGKASNFRCLRKTA